MKRNILTIFLIFSRGLLFSQSKPIIYFCEKYEQGKEISISDRFKAGNLTMIIRSDKELGFDKVYVQAEKYNPRTKKFEYYKKYTLKVNRYEKFAYFSYEFKLLEPGIIRIFIMDWLYNTISSNLVEIVD